MEKHSKDSAKKVKRRRKSSIESSSGTPQSKEAKQRKVVFDVASASGLPVVHDEGASIALSVPGYRCRSFPETRKRFNLSHDDLQHDEKLWIIQIPDHIDIADLSSQTIDASGDVFEVNGKQFEMRQELFVPGNEPPDHVILPSDKRSKLKISVGLAGKLQLKEFVGIPEIKEPLVVPHVIEQPDSLAHEFRAFGAQGAPPPKKKKTTPKASNEPKTPKAAKSKKKKKKSRS